MDIFRLCRVCLNDSRSFSNVFEVLMNDYYLYEVMNDVCQLEVKSNDGLPQFLCCECHRKLVMFDSFKRLSHKGHATLQSFKSEMQIVEVKVEPDFYESEYSREGSIEDDAKQCLEEVAVKVEPVLYESEYPREGSIEDDAKQRLEELPLMSAAVTGCLNLTYGADKNNLEERREEGLHDQVQRIEGMKELCYQNIVSEEFEGIQIHERKRDLKSRSLSCLSHHGYFLDNGAEGKEDTIDASSVKVHFNVNYNFKDCSCSNCMEFKSTDQPVDRINKKFEPLEEQETSKISSAYDEPKVLLWEGKHECCMYKVSEAKEHNACCNVNTYGSSNCGNLTSGEKYCTLDVISFKSELLDYEETRNQICNEGSVVEFNEQEQGRDHDLVVCNHCGKECLDKRNLLCHLTVHSGQCIAEYGSAGLDISSTSEHIIKQDSDISRRNPKVQCTCRWCGKEFPCASALTIHELVHTGERPFSCKYCSKRFSQRSSLSRHEFIHSGVKPHICRYCLKTFSLKSNLNSHELIHTGLKQHECEYCSKRFSLRNELKKHQLIHTGIKRHVCIYCSKRFSLKHNLNIHELIHTGVKPYACHVCDKRFSQKSTLNRHAKIHL